MVDGAEKYKPFQGKKNVSQVVFNTGNTPLRHATFVFPGFCGIQLLGFA